MSKILAGLLITLCLASGAFAQCHYTPIVLGKVYTTTDSGTGPYELFYIRGNNFPLTGYSQGSTVNLAGTTTLYIDHANPYGYVDVYAMYGGCNYSWSYTLYAKNVFKDVTTNMILWQNPGLNFLKSALCGAVPSCAFNTNDYNYPNTTPFSLVVGHTYTLTGYVEATVSGSGGGTSQLYAQTITIVAH